MDTRLFKLSAAAPAFVPRAQTGAIAPTLTQVSPVAVPQSKSPASAAGDDEDLELVQIAIEAQKTYAEDALIESMAALDTSLFSLEQTLEQTPAASSRFLPFMNAAAVESPSQTALRSALKVPNSAPAVAGAAEKKAVQFSESTKREASPIEAVAKDAASLALVDKLTQLLTHLYEEVALGDSEGLQEATSQLLFTLGNRRKKSCSDLDAWLALNDDCHGIAVLTFTLRKHVHHPRVSALSELANILAELTANKVQSRSEWTGFMAGAVHKFKLDDVIFTLLERAKKEGAFLLAERLIRIASNFCGEIEAGHLRTIFTDERMDLVDYFQRDAARKAPEFGNLIAYAECIKMTLRW